MDHRDALEIKHREIVEEMAAITRMRRSTVNEQYFEVRQKDGSVVRHGPYFLYSRTEKGKSFSRRIGLSDQDDQEKKRPRRSRRSSTR